MRWTPCGMSNIFPVLFLSVIKSYFIKIQVYPPLSTTNSVVWRQMRVGQFFCVQLATRIRELSLKSTSLHPKERTHILLENIHPKEIPNRTNIFINKQRNKTNWNKVTNKQQLRSLRKTEKIRIKEVTSVSACLRFHLFWAPYLCNFLVCKLVLSFGSVDEILKCDHSNES